ncbi:hypothetical protein [Pedobacter gandavensis]|uniref:hypothetical protein n=1 Tax=Pedobacter gandavensis TaxID=2679963 RepID=UPI00292D435A|nr:hypothetical protein [Pedobacter gandavensis]
MKHTYLLFILPIALAIFGCNQQPRHPQAELIQQASATAMTDKSILQYVDSIQANLASLEKQSSLIYLQGEQSMYVEKYNSNGKPVLYEENIDNKLISNRIRRYYLKNDSLILLEERTKDNKGITELRRYFRNNIAFKQEKRTAAEESGLKKQAYATITSGSSEENTAPTDTEQASTTQTASKEVQQLKIMEDAIAQNGSFTLYFDQFIDIPEESIIQLKSNARNGYTANVIVRKNDALTDSLQHQAEEFKNKRLNFKWVIADKEAVYVPVAANVTSAKGLNK